MMNSLITCIPHWSHYSRYIESYLLSKSNLTLPASGKFYCLLITFAISLDSDQNFGSDLDPNCLTR